MPVSIKRLLLPLSVLPVIALMAYGLTKDPKAIPSPLVRKPAPAFELGLFEGGRLSSRELQGKIVLLNFWASWCYPACWNEAPRLEAAWRKYRDRGVVVLGVNVQDTEEKAREFMRRFGKTFPNGPDRTGKLSIDYGLYGVPETFFIDREWRISHKHVGELTTDVLEREIGVLLGAAR
ncbi:MAG: TlpA family protein disulfide reductase [Deltaproteobacteria bacterium]|nr:TlpA family protein disulfide reductase [Deltaproteobacteria bacterium]